MRSQRFLIWSLALTGLLAMHGPPVARGADSTDPQGQRFADVLTARRSLQARRALLNFNFNARPVRPAVQVAAARRADLTPSVFNVIAAAQSGLDGPARRANPGGLRARLLRSAASSVIRLTRREFLFDLFQLRRQLRDDLRELRSELRQGLIDRLGFRMERRDLILTFREERHRLWLEFRFGIPAGTPFVL